MVGGYLPASFLDWEGHVAPVIFTPGCNFRCPWCHNRDIVLAPAGEIRLANVLEDIERRKKFLDGVVITGGEPTFWPALMPLLLLLKKNGWAVKLDTNGSNPALLRKILDEKLVSHVAMDVKAPFDDEILAKAAGVKISAAVIKRSAEIIKKLAPSYEFRTTWSPRILSAEQLAQIQKDLARDPNWVVQPFVPVNCLDPEYCGFPKTDPEDIRRLLPGVKVRG